MAGKSTTLVIRILADASQAAKTMSGAGGKLTGGLQKAVLPAGLVMAGLGAMGKAAADDAKGQALLAKQMQNTAGASKEQVAAVEDWITKTTLATGVADDKLRPALSTLVRASGDVTQSQKDMATVLDVSAATGKDAESVASAVAKAYAGNTTALGKMVPGMDKAVLKGGDMTAIMDDLAKKTGGSAAAAADTASGKWQRAQVAFAETKESIGGALLPMLDKLGGKLAAFGAWASKNTKTVQTLALVLGGMALAVLAVNAALKVYQATTKVVAAATKAWAIVQWLLNAAMSANPVVLIIVGIMLLVAALVIAYKKSATFRAIVQAAFRAVLAAANAVKKGVVTAFTWVKDRLIAIWGWIKTNVIDKLVAGFKSARDTARDVTTKIGEVWEGIKSVMKTVYDWIKTNVIDPMVALFDKVTGAIQTVIDWISKIKIPKPVQWLIDHAASLVTGNAAVTIAPAPQVGARGRTSTRAADPATGAPRTALDALSTPEVIVQVSDRKMAQLVDVSIRASATSAARNLTRRRVVTV